MSVRTFEYFDFMKAVKKKKVKGGEPVETVVDDSSDESGADEGLQGEGSEPEAQGSSETNIQDEGDYDGLSGGGQYDPGEDGPNAAPDLSDLLAEETAEPVRMRYYSMRVPEPEEEVEEVDSSILHDWQQLFHHVIQSVNFLDNCCHFLTPWSA
ncbi:hypothetical protein B0H13DRAFT_2315985 [Mycena leptocephala]|nr:hypothetical protein B0H13DRAFT_2315985 [Mycena leptocephala]